MESKGKYAIPASPDAVWAALHEPEMLAAAIPGCEGVDKISPNEFRVRATVKIGPVRAQFDGKVDVQELPMPAGAARTMFLTGEGQGGPAGFVRGESQVRLFEEREGTRLEYETKATIGGRLAQVGQRAIDGAAKELADEFFGKFAILMQAQKAPLAPPLASTQTYVVPPSQEEGLAPQIWVAGLIAIIIILLIAFSIVL
jgi:carbon monoxide dehydrogenase subunit G